ncbi:MAG TPA: septum formation initiator family protein [Devosiaceae bacterium]
MTAVLLAFQGYLGYSALNGQFGIWSQEQMQKDIEGLKAHSAVLAAEVDSYHHLASLYDPARLDPDLLTEQARALLNMAHPDEVVVMLDESGKPIGGSSFLSTERQLNTNIPTGID